MSSAFVFSGYMTSNDGILTLMQHNYVASTLVGRHFNIICLPGYLHHLLLSCDDLWIRVPCWFLFVSHLIFNEIFCSLGPANWSPGIVIYNFNNETILCNKLLQFYLVFKDNNKHIINNTNETISI